jgi:hypothetical protein
MSYRYFIIDPTSIGMNQADADAMAAAPIPTATDAISVTSFSLPPRSLS